MFVLSLQHAGSRADCYFTLRASGRRSYGTEQLVVHVFGLRHFSMWAARSKCGWEHRTASVRGRRGFRGGGGVATLQYGTSETRVLVRGRGPSMSLRELREPGSRLAQDRHGR